MKVIRVTSCLSSGLDLGLAQAHSIEIEDSPIGQGGFGVAYRAVSIDGLSTPPQVVKLLTQGGATLTQHGFSTVQELQARLSRARARRSGAGPDSLVREYPCLAGVPQLSFEGTLDGRPVHGYTANDLVAAGLEEFGKVLEDDKKLARLQALPFASRMRIASQLVSAFGFLSSEIRFIHADVKAEALFVDLSGLRCALIDFDSGALARDANDKPTTYGTRQGWLAPEITRQLDAAGNGGGAVQVDLLSDTWSVNVAVHFILFGIHPFFFLSEVSDRSIGAYFAGSRWPEADPGFAFYRREYARVHSDYVDYLRTSIPREVLERLQYTINRGYLDPTARTTYGQWQTVLAATGRAEVRRFTADRALVTDARPVRLSWEVRGAARLEILGVGELTGLSHVDVVVRRDSAFTLVVTGVSGPPVKRTIHVAVSKEPPRIRRFDVDKACVPDGCEVQVRWQVEGAEAVRIDPGIGPVAAEGLQRMSAGANQRMVLSAESQFGVTASAECALEVVRRSRLSSVKRTLLTSLRPTPLDSLRRTPLDALRRSSSNFVCPKGHRQRSLDSGFQDRDGGPRAG